MVFLPNSTFARISNITALFIRTSLKTLEGRRDTHREICAHAHTVQEWNDFDLPVTCMDGVHVDRQEGEGGGGGGVGGFIDKQRINVGR